MSHRFFLFAFVIFLLVINQNQNFIFADVISLNAGGSTNLSVTTDRYIEGFFFAQPAVITPVPPPPPPTPPGGGGVPTIPTVQNILISPSEFNVNLAVNTTTERTIKVTNSGATTATVFVSSPDLGNHVILTNNSLTISPGQTVDLKVIFVALSTPGIYTGTILIDGKEVLVSLNVKTQLLLFDSNIVVLNKDFKVKQGDQLQTLVTLIPLGGQERLDVTLNFVVKDYKNKVYLTKSETMLVENLTQIKKNFDTGNLQPGDYIIGLELTYPNGVAPSSAHFIVEPKTPLLENIIFLLIMMIILVIILIIIIVLLRRRKEKQEEQSSIEQEIKDKIRRI